MIVRIKVTNSCDTSLNYHFCAEKARERSCVYRCTHALFSSSLHNSRFFSVETDAFVEIDTLLYVVIASLATALIAVYESKCCTIVPSRNYSVVFCDNCTIASLHAVRSWSSQLRQFHKVSVKRWSDKFLIIEIKIL